MTWQARVYGGMKTDGDIPEPSNASSKATETGQEQRNDGNDNILSVLAFDTATVEIARKRLLTMHELGQSWYVLGRLYQKPAGTIQHWANGRGRIDGEMIEAILNTRLHYVTLDPDVVAVRRPSGRQRPYVRRPWMGAELTAAMDAVGMTDADVRRILAREVAGRVPGVEGYSEVRDDDTTDRDEMRPRSCSVRGCKGRRSRGLI